MTSGQLRPWLLACGLLAIIAAIIYLLPPQALSLEGMQHYQRLCEQFFIRSPWLTVTLYFCLYVLLTALSIPGATLMTLLGGACFHLPLGTLLVSFASTAGATLAMLISRYYLRDRVQRRFATQLVKVNQGIERDGAYYLFALRLMPLFPFFVVNLIMGLTTLSVRRFWWVSQLGMLPATLVYVNAGQQLAAINRLSDIVSPAMMLTFILLGALPLLSRLIVKRLITR
ncbi:TVP38/TMEM64 family protein [Salmonella enterica subsp. enterica serovar Choleraesuis]|nr:TVP38/TMEM64 family protein [Salmonella enterica subsp. enterica serovar Choleraesuis]